MMSRFTTPSFAARLLIAPLFLISGVGKIADPAATIGYIASTGAALPEVGYAGAIALEVAGSLLLIAGIQLRVVASLLALFSIVTAVFFHSQFGDQNQLVHFLKNLAIAGGLLQVAISAPSRAAAAQPIPAQARI